MAQDKVPEKWGGGRKNYHLFPRNCKWPKRLTLLTISHTPKKRKWTKIDIYFASVCCPSPGVTIINFRKKIFFSFFFFCFYAKTAGAALAFSILDRNRFPPQICRYNADTKNRKGNCMHAKCQRRIRSSRNYAIEGQECFFFLQDGRGKQFRLK